MKHYFINPGPGEPHHCTCLMSLLSDTHRIEVLWLVELNQVCLIRETEVLDQDQDWEPMHYNITVHYSVYYSVICSAADLHLSHLLI